VAAKVAGADNIVVVGLARDASRFETACKLGATHTLAIDEEDVLTRIKDITGGSMADLVIEVTSAGPEIINGGLSLLKKRGQMLCTAWKKSAVPLDIDRLIRYQASLRGVRGHSYESVELAINTMKSEKFPLDLISTHVVGLNEVDRALKIVGGEGQEKSIHITVEPWK
jgi:threonine dehydrogenase-like Zn-dependent dehydrogenase